MASTTNTTTAQAAGNAPGTARATPTPRALARRVILALDANPNAQGERRARVWDIRRAGLATRWGTARVRSDIMGICVSSNVLVGSPILAIFMENA